MSAQWCDLSRSARSDRPLNLGRIAPKARGFSYLLVIFAVAALGLLLAGTGQVWHTVAKREKEAELLFVGGEYRRAIASYRALTPEGGNPLPEKLDHLLLDPRFPYVRRHLRQRYRDPMTNSDDWGLLRLQGRIAGIYSMSEGKPLKQGGFDKTEEGFVGAKSYADWRFAAEGS